jgi:hypothetical protein
MFFAKFNTFFLHKNHQNIESSPNACATQSKTNKLIILFW